MSELDDLHDAIVRASTGASRFALEMRARGIHVGMGSPVVCVACDQPYPCPAAIGDHDA